MTWKIIMKKKKGIEALKLHLTQCKIRCKPWLLWPGWPECLLSCWWRSRPPILPPPAGSPSFGPGGAGGAASGGPGGRPAPETSSPPCAVQAGPPSAGLCCIPPTWCATSGCDASRSASALRKVKRDIFNAQAYVTSWKKKKKHVLHLSTLSKTQCNSPK